MMNSQASNYGRANFGQMSPFQDSQDPQEQYRLRQQNQQEQSQQALQQAIGQPAAATQQQAAPRPLPPPTGIPQAPPATGLFGQRSAQARQPSFGVPQMQNMGASMGRPQAPPQQPQMRQPGQAQQQAVRSQVQSGQPGQQMFSQPQQPQAPQQPSPDPDYDEYLSEFGPDDAEPPLSFEEFSQYKQQLDPQMLAQLSSGNPAVNAAIAPPARAGFNGINLDMVGGNVSPMALHGLVTDRAFSGGDPNSMKDALTRAFATNPVDLRGKSKEEVGAYLNSDDFVNHMAQNGLIEGQHWARVPGDYDKIMVNTDERGWTKADIVGNAGSADAVWTYQDLADAGMQQPEGNPALQQAIGGPQAGGEMLGNNLTDDPRWKALLEQLMGQAQVPEDPLEAFFKQAQA